MNSERLISSVNLDLYSPKKQTFPSQLANELESAFCLKGGVLDLNY